MPSISQTVCTLPSQAIFKVYRTCCSLLQKISAVYLRVISALVEFLFKHGWSTTAMVAGTFLTEPLQALKAALLLPLGWKRHFNFYHLNPKNITKEEAEKRPILLLHGNFHNQSAWIFFAKKLKGANLGPVYTLNLPSGSFSEEDRKRVNEKIAEIQGQYKKWGKENIQIDLVGHSRGAALARYMALAQDSWHFDKGGTFSFLHDRALKREEIGKVICIGCPAPAWHSVDYIYEITGEWDVFEQDPALLPRQFKTNAGHLGLLYSPPAQAKVIEWL